MELIQRKILQHMNIPGLKKENILSHLQHVDSNHNDASMIKFEQQTQCIEQLDYALNSGDAVTNNAGLVGFHQIGNSEQFLQGETDLLNSGNSGLKSFLHCPALFDGSLLEKQQSVPPEPLQLPPPQNQEEHDNFGAESGRELDELFSMGKGTSQQFYYDDFDGFW